MWDVDGNAYIDLINSWGPMILGHAHPSVVNAAIQAVELSSSFGTPTPVEVEMAKLITQLVPSVEKVRMVNSGTEATMSALRVARGFTGRDKLIKFQGCYHGHGDSFLIAAGSGALTFGVPNSPGVTKGTAEDTLTAKFNDLDSVQQLVKANKGQIAAIIVEPVAGNMGTVAPTEGFLQGLRDICTQEGIVLIFDEVMTGFRLAIGGAQELYGIKPDMTTMGKIIGGGMPVGAYGGKTEIMDFVSPLGPVYQAGTLSGNPVAMHAGLAMLSHLKNNPQIYSQLDAKTAAICDGLGSICEKMEVPYTINRVGSMATLFFRKGAVRTFDEAVGSDTALYAKFFKGMLKRGIYLPPSQFEAFFVCSAIGDAEVGQILEAAEDSLAEVI